MRFLAVHPGPLMYTRVYLRLEPLGLELVAAAARRAGHEVRLVDLQVEDPRDFFRHLDRWRPHVVAFSCNYLPNLPEILDLAREVRLRLPGAFVVVGGHCASFIAEEILEHGEGAVDCVIRGEGEPAVAALLPALEQDRKAVEEVPGAVTLRGRGPSPVLIEDLDGLSPARDLLRHRRRYFIGGLDPAASIEFSRGCPWDCSFCSAWTFYGRSHRHRDPDRIVHELELIPEPGLFVVDDVAFIHAEQGLRIAEAVVRRGIRKEYYLETRGDILLKNQDVFRFWKELGLKYMFLGLEALDAEGLQGFRKRLSLTENFEALDLARSMGITVAVNIIADAGWDRERFRTVREFCLEIPEIVNVSVNTPYPGTETWHTESRRITTRDYRLFDIQHAVLPTRLGLREFYEELVRTQQVLYHKHMNPSTLLGTARMAAGHLLHGRTNFLKMLWNFPRVYDPERLAADHLRPVPYEMAPPLEARDEVDPRELYVHRSPRTSSEKAATRRL